MKQKHSQQGQERFNPRQTFALKKLSIGLVSVASGILLFWGDSENVFASEEYSNDGEGVSEAYMEVATINADETSQKEISEHISSKDETETIDENELVDEIETISNTSGDEKNR